MPKTIKIAAAASLENGLPQAVEEFLVEHPQYGGLNFTCKYDGSYALAREIVADVNNTFDVFLSADQDAMLNSGPGTNGIEAKIAPNTKTKFIENSLVLIKNVAGVANLTNITSFETLTLANLGSGHLWIANPYNAPAGARAREAITLTTPSGNWDALQAKASTDGTVGSNVQTTLDGFVNDSNPAVCIVYRSDYKNPPSIPSPKPNANAYFVTFAPKAVSTKIIYPGAVLTNAALQTHDVEEEATTFVTEFLKDRIELTERGFRATDSYVPEPGDPIDVINAKGKE